MGLFEENPILMVPFIVVVMMGYDLVKWVILRRVKSDGSRKPAR